MKQDQVMRSGVSKFDLESEKIYLSESAGKGVSMQEKFKLVGKPILAFIRLDEILVRWRNTYL